MERDRLSRQGIRALIVPVGKTRFTLLNQFDLKTPRRRSARYGTECRGGVWWFLVSPRASALEEVRWRLGRARCPGAGAPGVPVRHVAHLVANDAEDRDESDRPDHPLLIHDLLLELLPE